MDTLDKIEMLKELSQSYEGCQMCGLCENSRSVVFGEGSVDAKILVIGEAPSYEDDQSGDTFSGQAGEILDSFLASFNATREDTFLTNLVACRPATDKGKSRRVLSAELEACSERLHKIIEIVDPYILLLTGMGPIKALTKDKRSISAIAKDPFHVPVTAYTRGQCMTVKRPAIGTFSLGYLLKKTSMAEGADMHLAYQAWEKVFTLVDTYENLYNGTAIPNRE